MDRVSPRNWGNGTLKYNEEDLMTLEEIHSFGCEIVASHLEQDGYNIVLYNPTFEMYPNIIAEKESDALVILVNACLAPFMPKLKICDKYGIVSICEGKEGKPCFAPISIGSADKERFEKRIALVGDGYLIKYNGIEYLSKEIPEYPNEEYFIYLMQVIGSNLIAQTFELIEKYFVNCFDSLKEFVLSDELCKHTVVKCEEEFSLFLNFKKCDYVLKFKYSSDGLITDFEKYKANEIKFEVFDE